MTRKLLLASLVSAACALAACGGGGSSSDNSKPSMAGVWDGSEDLGQEGFDENYLVIDSNGSVSIYDYAGDSYDNAGNCYWIDRNLANIVLLHDNQYTITYPDVDYVATATIDVTKTKLTVTITSPDQGEPASLKRINRPVSDFTPECSSSFSLNKAEDKNQKLRISATKKLATLLF